MKKLIELYKTDRKEFWEIIGGGVLCLVILNSLYLL